MLVVMVSVAGGFVSVRTGIELTMFIMFCVVDDLMDCCFSCLCACKSLICSNNLII